MPTTTQAIDLDMLANDIADTLAKYDYPIDACETAIRPHLAEFIAKVQASIDARPETDDGNDAATWTPPPPEPEATLARPQPRYGRVRVYPIYVFSVYDPTDPDVTEVHVVDLAKQGEAAARAKAVATAPPGGMVGRRLRIEQYRWRPWAGTPRDARPDLPPWEGLIA